MTYPEKQDWTWDSVDEEKFNKGYVVRDPISNYSLPRLTPTLPSGRNFFDTCGKITYTVINPDYWDQKNGTNDPANSASFVSMFTNFFHDVLVGELTKPSFLAFTGNSLKAKIEKPYYETYHFNVSARLELYQDYTFIMQNLTFKVADKCLQASYEKLPQYLLKEIPGTKNAI